MTTWCRSSCAAAAASLGGSLTWEKPQHLAAFAADGPFAGLAVPKDVTVSRQVLAEPDAVLATKSWASLEDGTPLVTGEHRGKGIVSLFHVSADMRWSDLPLSGTFVEMLQTDRRQFRLHLDPGRRRRRRGHQARRWRRCDTLDGFGAFGPPPAAAKPLPADYRDRATADHPPGFYGPAEGPLAVNTFAAADRIAPLETSALHARHASYTNAEPRDLRGMLLSAALRFVPARRHRGGVPRCRHRRTFCGAARRRPRRYSPSCSPPCWRCPARRGPRAAMISR